MRGEIPLEWTKQKLAHYIGDLRTVVEFRGITAEELEDVFRTEAMRRLRQVEEVLYNDYLSDDEKLAAIGDLVK